MDRRADTIYPISGEAGLESWTVWVSGMGYLCCMSTGPSQKGDGGQAIHRLCSLIASSGVAREAHPGYTQLGK